MSLARAVIIEDEVLLANHLRFLLTENKFEAQAFHNAEEFIHSLSTLKRPTLFLIDMQLPGLKGLELVKLIRVKDKVSPIFMLSGTANEKDVTECLKSGADDFLSKPYNPEHLVLKLLNAQERLKLLMSSMIDIGLKLIPEAHLVMKDGIKVKLTRREFEILDQLIKTPGEIHSREDLVAKIEQSEITDRTIDVHVSSLRKKIKPLNVIVETYRNQGYKVTLN